MWGPHGQPWSDLRAYPPPAQPAYQRQPQAHPSFPQYPGPPCYGPTTLYYTPLERTASHHRAFDWPAPPFHPTGTYCPASLPPGISQFQSYHNAGHSVTVSHYHTYYQEPSSQAQPEEPLYDGVQFSHQQSDRFGPFNGYMPKHHVDRSNGDNLSSRPSLADASDTNGHQTDRRDHTIPHNKRVIETEDCDNEGTIVPKRARTGVSSSANAICKQSSYSSDIVIKQKTSVTTANAGQSIPLTGTVQASQLQSSASKDSSSFTHVARGDITPSSATNNQSSSFADKNHEQRTNTTKAPVSDNRARNNSRFFTTVQQQQDESLRHIACGALNPESHLAKNTSRLKLFLDSAELAAEEPNTNTCARFFARAQDARDFLDTKSNFSGPIVCYDEALQVALPYRDLDEMLQDKIAQVGEKKKIPAQDSELPHYNISYKDFTLGQVRDHFSSCSTSSSSASTAPASMYPKNFLSFVPVREEGCRPIYTSGGDFTFLKDLSVQKTSERLQNRQYWATFADSGAITVPHMDAAGMDTTLTCLQGEVGIGYLDNPTPEQWRAFLNNPEKPPVGSQWRLVVLRRGNSIFMPAGLVHFVVREAGVAETPTVTLGSHLIRKSQISKWVELCHLQIDHPAVVNEDPVCEAFPWLLLAGKYFQAKARKAPQGWEGEFGGRGAVDMFWKQMKALDPRVGPDCRFDKLDIFRYRPSDLAHYSEKTRSRGDRKSSKGGKKRKQ